MVDEYTLEIDSLRRTLERLRLEEADAPLIDEYETELRILRALYEAALRTLTAGDVDRRLRGALERLGFGAWDLINVYGFVYERAMEVNTEGRDLAALIGEMDFARPDRGPRGLNGRAPEVGAGRCSRVRRSRLGGCRAREA